MKSFELLSKIALSTINTSNFDAQMNSILELTGRHTQVSRTYIFIDNEDNTATSNRYEWCNTGIEPQINDLQDVPYELIPSWRNMLMEKGRVYSENILELPKDLVQILEPQGILSIVVYPVYILNKIQGFVGFDECTNTRKWDEAELNLLATISGIISNIYDKHYFLKKIDEEKTNFENFINTVKDFIFIADLDKNILFTNNSVEKELGYPRNELLKMNLVELHPAEKREEVLEICALIFNNEREYCPVEFAKKDGGIVPVITRIWFAKWNNRDCIFGFSKNLSVEQELLQKFTKLFQNNPALMAVSRLPERRFIDVNASFIEKLGYSYDEVIGKTSAELGLFVQADQQSEIAEEIQKHGRLHNIELQVRCKDNTVLDGLISGETIESQGKQYLLTVMIDITKQKYLQDLYDHEKTRLNSIIDGSRLGTWEWNIQTGETVFNEKWAEIIGYTLSELHPASIETWIKYAHPDDLKDSDALLEKHFNGEREYYDLECRMKHKDGHWVWVYDRGKVIEWDDEGKPLMMYGTHADVTEKKEMENRIKELSIRDPLTNVYNRRYIYDIMEKDLLKFKRTGIVFSISILDLDYFKQINDTYGHLAGDHILKEFTAIISGELRESDLLGRFGGEEFIIVSYNSEKEQTAVLVNRILEKVRSGAFHFNNDEIRFTFSCGISDVTESVDTDIEEIVSIADRRLYGAKSAGRNRIIFNGND